MCYHVAFFSSKDDNGHARNRPVVNCLDWSIVVHSFSPDLLFCLQPLQLVSIKTRVSYYSVLSEACKVVTHITDGEAVELESFGFGFTSISSFGRQ